MFGRPRQKRLSRSVEKELKRINKDWARQINEQRGSTFIENMADTLGEIVADFSYEARSLWRTLGGKTKTSLTSAVVLSGGLSGLNFFSDDGLGANITDGSNARASIIPHVIFREPETNVPVPGQALSLQSMFDAGSTLYTVPGDIDSILRRLTNNGPIPYSVAVNICGSESGFNNGAVSYSGVKGVCQVAWDTFLQEGYRAVENGNSGPYPFPDYALEVFSENVEQYVKSEVGGRPSYGYRIKRGGSSDAIQELREDTETSLTMGLRAMLSHVQNGTENYRQKIENLVLALDNKNTGDNEEYNAWVSEIAESLIRDITTDDLKLFYVFGPGDGANVLAALADPEKRAGNHAIADYVNGGNNDSLVYQDFPRNRIRNGLTDLEAHFERVVGSDPLPRAMVPEYRPNERVAGLLRRYLPENSFN